MEPIHFLYFSEENIRDRAFVNDALKNYKLLRGHGIILHEGISTSLDDIRMFSKRLSGQLSEMLVPNLAVSGDQRNILTYIDNNLIIKTVVLEQLFQSVNCLIINALSVREKRTELSQIPHVLKAFRQQIDIENMFFFPLNSMSPLGGIELERITSEEDYQNLIVAYPEEKKIIDLAYSVKPSIIASAKNYSQSFR